MKLSPKMTTRQFDNGYWYTNELREFAKRIGIPGAARLRKDELEKSVKIFLKTGQLKNPTRRSLKTFGEKDVERGLHLDLPIRVYTNNKETKDFLEKEAQRMSPGLKRKSGARYRLNRWREAQITAGKNTTYRDLVKEYVRLNQSDDPFAKIPHGRYINFLSEFLKAEKGATRADAITAWKRLKQMDVPKDYRSWKSVQS
jgi:hypothetical protein